MPTIRDFQSWPDAHGRFGDFGGQYVAETLMAPLAELTEGAVGLEDVYFQLTREGHR